MKKYNNIHEEIKYEWTSRIVADEKPPKNIETHLKECEECQGYISRAVKRSEWFKKHGSFLTGVENQNIINRIQSIHKNLYKYITNY